MAVPIETRRQRVDAEAGRLADLGAVLIGVLERRRPRPLRSRDERP